MKKPVHTLAAAMFAATLSLSLTFDVYKSVDAHADFLEIEHYGARGSNLFEAGNVVHGEALLLKLLESTLERGGGPDDLRALASREVLEHVLRENDQLRAQMYSRSWLFGRWISLLRTKAMRAS